MAEFTAILVYFSFGQGLLILHYVTVELSASQLNISYYVVQYMKLPGRKYRY